MLLVAAGLIRREDPQPSWALPGGVVAYLQSNLQGQVGAGAMWFYRRQTARIY